MSMAFKVMPRECCTYLRFLSARTMRPILKSKANLVMMDRAWALTDTSRNGLSGLKQQKIRRLWSLLGPEQE